MNESFFTIIIPVYNQYELLRQAVESILHNINPRSYKEIIIVDDYSDPNSKLREYENYLNGMIIREDRFPTRKIRVMMSDEYRICFHCSDHDIEIAKEKGNDLLPFNKFSKGTSMGHSFSLTTGCKEVTTPYVFCMDADSAALKGSWDIFYHIKEIFEKNPKVMSVGQLAGIQSNEVVVVKKSFKYVFGCRNTSCGGYPGSPAFACRMSGWTEKNLDWFSSEPTKIAWVAGRYCDHLFERGFYTANYPMFSRPNFFHAGGAILNRARPGRRLHDSWGFCKDYRNRYGPRQGTDSLRDYYAGGKVINLTTEEYINYLKDKYNKPFSEIQEPLDEKLLYYLVDIPIQLLENPEMEKNTYNFDGWKND